MARKSHFMKWLDHQVDTEADLRRKVDECLDEMLIEQKLEASRSQHGHHAGTTRPATRRTRVSYCQARSLRSP